MLVWPWGILSIHFSISIQDARSAPDAALSEIAIKTETNSVFKTTHCPDTEGKQATKLKILLTLKFDKDGSVDRYKARMVYSSTSKEFPQWIGRDFCTSLGQLKSGSNCSFHRQLYIK